MKQMKKSRKNIPYLYIRIKPISLKYVITTKNIICIRCNKYGI